MPTSSSPAVLEDVSIVIPTLGRPILRSCLRAIETGSHWPTRLIVVDQGARPEVAGWLTRLADAGLATEYVPSQERGRALGVNRGIARVRTPYVAITDDDCLVEPDWLVGLVRVLRGDPRCVVTGRVEAAGEEVVASVVVGRQAFVRSRPSLAFDPLSGGNMAAPLDVFRTVGLLDEDPVVRCAEDGEWAYRALRAGVAIRYAPEAGVRHIGWRRAEERAAQYRAYARSQGGFYGKYLARGDAFIALRIGVHQLRALRRWARGALRGDADAALMGRAYATGLLPGVLAGLRSGWARDGRSAPPP